VVTENRWRILSDSDVVELGDTGLPSAENTFPSCPALQQKELMLPICKQNIIHFAGYIVCKWATSVQSPINLKIKTVISY
jgi:hypothetical protein